MRLNVGISCRVGICGALHPSKLMIAVNDTAVHTVIVKLPEGVTWLNAPHDAVLGDMREGTRPSDVNALLAKASTGKALRIMERHKKLEILTGLELELESFPIDEHIQDQSYAELKALQENPKEVI